MKPIGTITRGTTNPNRLRRVDRYLAGVLTPVLLAPHEGPVVVDLGYGKVPTTALELYARLARVRSDVRVLGIEIEPDRVEAGKPFEHDSLQFRRGGFEVPVPQGWPRPTLIRAMNVLRQYDESEVPQAWERVLSALAPGGAFVEGTCDELGRLGSWITLTGDGPAAVTFSWKVDEIDLPSTVAERLPKALIHHNVDGEPVHEFLAALDKAWRTTSPYATFGARQRFVEMVKNLRAAGVAIQGSQARWKLGEITVGWDLVAPRTGPMARR